MAAASRARNVRASVLVPGGFREDAVDDDVTATDPDLVEFEISPLNFAQGRGLRTADQDKPGPGRVA